MALIVLASLASLTASASAGHSGAEHRTVKVRLIHAGYVRVGDNYLAGPEGTDQVWAEWRFRSCGKGNNRQTYAYHQLVHAVSFPKRGGLYVLSVGPSGNVEKLTPLSPEAKTTC